MSVQATARAPSRRWSRAAIQEALGGYLFISPWVLGFLIFGVGPMLASLYFSLTQYNIVSEPKWVGLDNYIYALTGRDRLFYISMLNTAKFAALVVPLGVLTSLALAGQLNRGIRGPTVLRTVFFLPSLTPIAAIAILWLWLLHPDLGPINYVFSLFGVKGPRWLSDQVWVIPSMAIIGIWAAAGGSRMIIFLAGLQGVPQEMYDAASIDGAGPLQRLWHITLPLISPVIFFNVVLGVIGAFRVFALAFVATDGGPAYASWFYLLNLYQNIRDLRMGYGSMLAWIFFLVVLVFTYVQFRMAVRWVYYAGDQAK